MNLEGTWRVKVTSGPRWFRMLNLLRDRKIIYNSRGHNVAWRKKWGKFTVTEVDDEFILKYINQPIVGKLRDINEDELSGEFYYKEKLIGNFSMLRILKGRK